MKFIISNPNKNLNLINFFRNAGYHFDGQLAGESAFYRSLSSALFPRFHIYVKKFESGWEINLHLDQKRPSYEGSHAHSGEYEGELVEKESTRLKRLLIIKPAIEKSEDW